MEVSNRVQINEIKMKKFRNYFQLKTGCYPIIYRHPNNQNIILPLNYNNIFVREQLFSEAKKNKNSGKSLLFNSYNTSISGAKIIESPKKTKLNKKEKFLYFNQIIWPFVLSKQTSKVSYYNPFYYFPLIVPSPILLYKRSKHMSNSLINTSKQLNNILIEDVLNRQIPKISKKYYRGFNIFDKGHNVYKYYAKNILSKKFFWKNFPIIYRGRNYVNGISPSTILEQQSYPDIVSHLTPSHNNFPLIRGNFLCSKAKRPIKFFAEGTVKKLYGGKFFAEGTEKIKIIGEQFPTKNREKNFRLWKHSTLAELKFHYFIERNSINFIQNSIEKNFFLGLRSSPPSFSLATVLFLFDGTFFYFYFYGKNFCRRHRKKIIRWQIPLRSPPLLASLNNFYSGVGWGGSPLLASLIKFTNKFFRGNTELLMNFNAVKRNTVSFSEAKRTKYPTKKLGVQNNRSKKFIGSTELIPFHYVNSRYSKLLTACRANKKKLFCKTIIIFNIDFGLTKTKYFLKRSDLDLTNTVKFYPIGKKNFLYFQLAKLREGDMDVLTPSNFFSEAKRTVPTAKIFPIKIKKGTVLLASLKKKIIGSEANRLLPKILRLNLKSTLYKIMTSIDIEPNFCYINIMNVYTSHAKFLTKYRKKIAKFELQKFLTIVNCSVINDFYNTEKTLSQTEQKILGPLLHTYNYKYRLNNYTFFNNEAPNIMRVFKLSTKLKNRFNKKNKVDNIKKIGHNDVQRSYPIKKKKGTVKIKIIGSEAKSRSNLIKTYKMCLTLNPYNLRLYKTRQAQEIPNLSIQTKPKSYWIFMSNFKILLLTITKSPKPQISHAKMKSSLKIFGEGTVKKLYGGKSPIPYHNNYDSEIGKISIQIFTYTFLFFCYIAESPFYIYIYIYIYIYKESLAQSNNIGNLKTELAKLREQTPYPIPLFNGHYDFRSSVAEKSSRIINLGFLIKLYFSSAKEFLFINSQTKKQFYKIYLPLYKKISTVSFYGTFFHFYGKNKLKFTTSTIQQNIFGLYFNIGTLSLSFATISNFQYKVCLPSDFLKLNFKKINYIKKNFYLFATGTVKKLDGDKLSVEKKKKTRNFLLWGPKLFFCYFQKNPCYKYEKNLLPIKIKKVPKNNNNNNTVYKLREHNALGIKQQCYSERSSKAYKIVVAKLREAPSFSFANRFYRKNRNLLFDYILKTDNPIFFVITHKKFRNISQITKLYRLTLSDFQLTKLRGLKKNFIGTSVLYQFFCFFSNFSFQLFSETKRGDFVQNFDLVFRNAVQRMELAKLREETPYPFFKLAKLRKVEPTNSPFFIFKRYRYLSLYTVLLLFLGTFFIFDGKKFNIVPHPKIMCKLAPQICTPINLLGSPTLVTFEKNRGSNLRVHNSSIFDSINFNLAMLREDPPNKSFSEAKRTVPFYKAVNILGSPTPYEIRETSLSFATVLVDGTFFIFYGKESFLPKATVVPSQLRSGELRSGELRSGELRSGELRSGELRSGELRSYNQNMRPPKNLLTMLREEVSPNKLLTFPKTSFLNIKNFSFFMYIDFLKKNPNFLIRLSNNQKYKQSEFISSEKNFFLSRDKFNGGLAKLKKRTHDSLKKKKYYYLTSAFYGDSRSLNCVSNKLTNSHNFVKKIYLPKKIKIKKVPKNNNNTVYKLRDEKFSYLAKLREGLPPLSFANQNYLNLIKTPTVLFFCASDKQFFGGNFLAIDNSIDSPKDNTINNVDNIDFNKHRPPYNLNFFSEAKRTVPSAKFFLFPSALYRLQKFLGWQTNLSFSKASEANNIFFDFSSAKRSCSSLSLYTGVPKFLILLDSVTKYPLLASLNKFNNIGKNYDSFVDTPFYYQSIKKKIKYLVKNCKNKPAPILIAKINNEIRILRNQYKHYYKISTVSFDGTFFSGIKNSRIANIDSNFENQICKYLNTLLFKYLWNWAKKRHNNRPKKWIYSKYWYNIGVYADKEKIRWGGVGDYVLLASLLENNLENYPENFVKPRKNYFLASLKKFLGRTTWGLRKFSGSNYKQRSPSRNTSNNFVNGSPPLKKFVGLPTQKVLETYKYLRANRLYRQPKNFSKNLRVSEAKRGNSVNVVSPSKNFLPKVPKNTTVYKLREEVSPNKLKKENFLNKSFWGFSKNEVPPSFVLYKHNKKLVTTFLKLIKKKLHNNYTVRSFPLLIKRRLLIKRKPLIKIKRGYVCGRCPATFGPVFYTNFLSKISSISKSHLYNNKKSYGSTLQKKDFGKKELNTFKLHWETPLSFHNKILGLVKLREETQKFIGGETEKILEWVPPYYFFVPFYKAKNILGSPTPYKKETMWETTWETTSLFLLNFKSLNHLNFLNFPYKRGPINIIGSRPLASLTPFSELRSPYNFFSQAKRTVPFYKAKNFFLFLIAHYNGQLPLRNTLQSITNKYNGQNLDYTSNYEKFLYRVSLSFANKNLLGLPPFLASLNNSSNGGLREEHFLKIFFHNPRQFPIKFFWLSFTSFWLNHLGLKNSFDPPRKLNRKLLNNCLNTVFNNTKKDSVGNLGTPVLLASLITESPLRFFEKLLGESTKDLIDAFLGEASNNRNINVRSRKKSISEAKIQNIVIMSKQEIWVKNKYSQTINNYLKTDKLLEIWQNNLNL
nr:hypothetical protein [Borodinellopsis texensis]